MIPTSIPSLKPRRFRTSRTVIALILREMATTYGRSPGGYFWAIAEPVAMIAVLSIAFSLMLRSPSLGTNFQIFYATAFLPFTLYAGIAQKVSASITFSRALLAYPAVTFVDAIIARFLLELLTKVLVFYIVIVGIELIYDVRPILDFPSILMSLGMAAALGLGIGTLNCVLTSLFTVWQSVWRVINRPLFLVSGVFFIYEDLPSGLRSFLWYNPLLHVTGEMRRGFFATYDATYISHTFVMSVALVSGALGLLLLRRYHRLIINER
ncbi:capsular polysaccharide transport system permease protein [Rhodovulum iodosum]|uniref:Transport permease protein n=1 Tax=Rhodovulum iodosum TaxID=68291 RepID=A0ABV3XRV1_9RHOB|nr:ABC transporter permease [Rhodovulum robiginosum]RSK30398.1 sugar ABC transporter permease [Rhodovulum robiginosum]